MTNRAHPVAETPDVRIRRLYPDLSATERQLADVVLAQYDTVFAYSATELAQQAQVSKASAARFFRRLGFDDFNGFRAAMRAAATPQAPLHRMAPRATRKHGGIEARLQTHAARDAGCLDRVPATIDAAAIEQGIERLARAKRVWVIGYRNAHTVAFYAHALLHQVRAQVRLVDEAAGRESEWLADLEPGDLVFAIDLRRRTRRLTQLLEAVHAGGTPIVLMTDVLVSALDAKAVAVLRSPSHFAQIFDAYVAPISLVNFIACEVAARMDATTRKRLARIEALHEALDDLDPDTATDARTVT